MRCAASVRARVGEVHVCTCRYHRFIYGVCIQQSPSHLSLAERNRILNTYRNGHSHSLDIRICSVCVCVCLCIVAMTTDHSLSVSFAPSLAHSRSVAVLSIHLIYVSNKSRLSMVMVAADGEQVSCGERLLCANDHEHSMPCVSFQFYFSFSNSWLVLE